MNTQQANVETVREGFWAGLSVAIAFWFLGMLFDHSRRVFNTPAAGMLSNSRYAEPMKEVRIFDILDVTWRERGMYCLSLVMFAIAAVGLFVAILLIMAGLALGACAKLLAKLKPPGRKLRRCFYIGYPIS